MTFVEPERVTHWLCPANKPQDEDSDEPWHAGNMILTQTMDEPWRQRRYVCQSCGMEITVNFPPAD